MFVLENDVDFCYYDGICKCYGLDDFFIIIYVLIEDFFREDVLVDIGIFKLKLEEFSRVFFVVSFFDVLFV